MQDIAGFAQEGLADADALMALMAQDKKVKRGKLTFILLEAVGRAVIANDVEPALVRDFLQSQTVRKAELCPDDTTWTGLPSPSSLPACCVSAFFSASETALTGASRASMLRLSKQGNREAGVVSSLIGMRERMIGALLLGNNIANIGASALATGIFTAWFGEVGVLYATGVMTVLVVIFAEVLPKTIAINAPDRVSLLVARPMRLMLYLLGPLLTMIEAIVRVLMRRSASRSAPTSRSCRRPNVCAARSICSTMRARSKSRTATCSAACWT